jgi:hypothetical protein
VKGSEAYNSEPTDDLGRVGDLLRSEKDSVLVHLPVSVELLETLGRESNRGGGGKVKLLGRDCKEEIVGKGRWRAREKGERRCQPQLRASLERTGRGWLELTLPESRKSRKVLKRDEKGRSGQLDNM